MRVIVSGGGTGGHITPILAVVSELEKLNPGIEVIYVGQKGNPIESRLLHDSNLDYKGIYAGKFRRFHTRGFRQILDLKTTFLNIRDMFFVMAGLLQSFLLIRRFKPDVVFVKGGYVGLPVGLMAGLMGVPLVLHDSDTVPGLTNRVLARWASTIATGFPVQYYDYPEDKAHYTGNPVRESFLDNHETELTEIKNLDTDRRLIVIFGGSLGAMRVNNIVIDQLENLLNKYEIVHISGPKEEKRVERLTKDLPKKLLEHYHLVGFIRGDMAALLKKADLVISRAGATAIAELAALNKATIIIPNPLLTGGHQTKNARALNDNEAASVLEESRVMSNSKSLGEEIDLVMSDKNLQDKYRKNIAQFANKSAATDVAKLIMSYKK